MTKQEIAIALFEMDWSRNGLDPEIEKELITVLQALYYLNKAEIVEIFFRVLETQHILKNEPQLKDLLIKFPTLDEVKQ